MKQVVVVVVVLCNDVKTFGQLYLSKSKKDFVYKSESTHQSSQIGLSKSK